MPKRLAASKREAILTEVRAGKARNAIARDHDVSPSSVTKLAGEAGMKDAFDRSHTKKATEAKAADHQATLAALAARHAKIASDVMDSFEAADHDWGKVSPHARGIILGICSDKARELAAPDEGVEAAKSLLDDFMTVAAEASRQLNKAG
jgi:uncharacterized protein with PIN domain